MGTLLIDLGSAAGLSHLVPGAIRLALSCHGISTGGTRLAASAQPLRVLDAIRQSMEELSDEYLPGDEKPVHASFLKLLLVAIQNTAVPPAHEMGALLAQLRAEGTVVIGYTAHHRPVGEMLLRKLSWQEGTQIDNLICGVPQVRPALPYLSELPPVVSQDMGLLAAILASRPDGPLLALSDCPHAQADLHALRPDVLLSCSADLVERLRCA